jgi:predicted metal-dependent phosphoesterase TrpH
MKLDLHLHSTASDGALGPADVVARARAGGLDVVAIADHDTVAGVPAALAAAGDDVRVVTAIEISATHRERDVHVLGYGIDPDHPIMEDYDARARTAREQRVREMIERLADLDVMVEFDAVRAEAGPDAAALARPHLARVLWAQGHVGSVSEAFDRYIGDEGPAFVPVQLLDVAGAIECIHQAGGLAIWAHPPMPMLGGALREFVEADLDGIECFRPRTTPEELNRLLNKARHHQLLVTGGSDWHGDWHGPLGSFHVDRADVAEFMERLDARSAH